MIDPKIPPCLPNAILEAYKRATAAAMTPEAARYNDLIRQHGHKRDTTEAKPWKKPWVS